VCVRDNLKTIAHLCFLSGNYVRLEKKSQTSSHVKIACQCQKVIFGGFKVIRKVMSCSDTGSEEIPSPMALLSRRSRQRERLSASVLSICSSVC